MSGGQPKKPTLEVPGKSAFELKKIESTAIERDEATNRLLPQLIPANKSVRKFVMDACKLSGINPPKEGDHLAPYVYKLQKQVCKFTEFDTANGRDGKLGPITFAELLLKIPLLAKGYSKKARTETHKDQRKGLATSMSATAPSVPKLSDHQRAIMVGDSLFKAPAKDFYAGSDKYKRYHKEYFKKSRSVVTARKRLSKKIGALKDVPAFTVWLGTNDLYRSANKIIAELKAIYTMILENNPNARIVAITLLPNPKYQNKIDEVNRWIKEFAAKHSKNVTVIDMHEQVIAAQQAGHKVFYSDGVHIRPKISKALSRILQDHLTENKNGQLTDYLA